MLACIGVGERLLRVEPELRHAVERRALALDDVEAQAAQPGQPERELCVLPEPPVLELLACHALFAPEQDDRLEHQPGRSTRCSGRPPTPNARQTTISSGRGASGMATSAASIWSKLQMSSLFVNGSTIVAPGPPTFFVDGMMSSPCSTAARTGAPNRGWRIAAACSSSPSVPTTAPLPYESTTPGSTPSASIARPDRSAATSAPSSYRGVRSST